MSVRRSAVMGALALSMVGMVAAYRLGRARADGVPMVNPLYYGGMLDDGGRPIEGTRNLTVRLWDAATAGATVCTTSAAGTAFSGGRFRVALDGACVGAVRANPELWAELQVDATTFPRSKLGAVPYALEAGRATSAAGALEARIAAVEARTGGRQIVIADVDAGSVSADASCEVGYTISSASAPFTFVASTTGIYRISTNIRYSGAGIVFRIGSVPSMPFYSRTATRTLESGLTSGTSAFYSGPITALVQLDAGHSYTFRLEERGSSVAIPGCNSPGGLQLISPLIAEQLN